jgi:hypothetical protein
MSNLVKKRQVPNFKNHAEKLLGLKRMILQSIRVSSKR